MGGYKVPGSSSGSAPRRPAAVQNTTAGGVTLDGKVDHSNFADKPVTTVAKKAASKKNVFFSDSDESDEPVSTKPQPKP